ncbi:MAG: hypothetical protein ACI94Y_002365 [Maribacter sp.]|jgi:hypothetical protein
MRERAAITSEFLQYLQHCLFYVFYKTPPKLPEGRDL